MEPVHTTYAVGPSDLIALIAANYRCGHCTSVTKARTDPHGNLHLNIHHDDGCPVLEGTLSPLPDTLRAANTHTA